MSVESAAGQIAELGCTQFEALLREVISGKLRQCEWNMAQVLEDIAWLERMHARGNNVFVQRSGEQGLPPIIRLAGANSTKSERTELLAALAVETACNKFDALEKLSGRGLSEQLRHLSKLELMSFTDYVGKKTAGVGYGSLAGFLNQVEGPERVWSRNCGGAHPKRPEAGSQANIHLEPTKTRSETGNKHPQDNAPTRTLPKLIVPGARRH